MRASIQNLFQKLSLSILLFIPLSGFSQAGTEFWLTIPELTISHGLVYNKGGMIKHVVVSTLASPARVTASVPADPTFKPIVIDLPPNTTDRIDFEEYSDLLELIEYDSVTKQGILIESTDVITAYLESVEAQNPDIFTLKGRHALGKDFYVPMQNSLGNNEFSNGVQAYCSIDIVATEDNTLVTIVPTKPVAKRGGGSYAAGTTITVTLNRGESYSVRALGFKATDHIGGTHVTSNRPIAVIMKDDSVLSGQGYDLIGDQMVPVNRTGSQYIIMYSGLCKANYGSDNATEYAYIVPTQNNTTIYIDGIKKGVYNAGENIAIGIKNAYTVISSDNQPFYCLHTVIATAEIAGALLPPTDQCSGSTQTGFSYSYGTEEEQELYMLMMVRKGAEDGFLVDGALAKWLDKTKFTDVSEYWSAAKFGPLTDKDIAEGPHLITNAKDLFHTGYINTTGSGALYGYFSDFETTEISAVAVKSNGKVAEYCMGEDIQLRVDGGVSYKWKAYDTNNPSRNIDRFIENPNTYNPIIKANIPQGSYTFVVTVGKACGGASVTDTVLIDIVPRPKSKTITVDFCESEIGGKCIDQIDLTSYLPQLTGADATDFKAIKWTKEVFDEMQMLHNFDDQRNIAITSINASRVSLGADNPQINKLNPSDKVLHYSVNTNSPADLRFGAKPGYPFDFSTGAIVSMKILNDRATLACNDRTFKLQFYNDGETDTISISQTLKVCNTWTTLKFDYSSFNTDKVYTRALLTHTGGYENHNHYIDDIQKTVTYRVDEIADASNARLCNNPKVSVVLENDKGCQITSTLNAKVVEGDFAVAQKTLATQFCEKELGSGCASELDLTPYLSAIIGSTAGVSAVKWEKEVLDEIHILEDFEDDAQIYFASAKAISLKFPYANPLKNKVNQSNNVLYYSVMGQSADLRFLPAGQQLFDFAAGDVATIKLFSDVGINNCKEQIFTLAFFNEGQNDTISAVAKLTDCNKWEELVFDFTSSKSDKTYSNAILKNNSEYVTYHFYIDDFSMFMDNRLSKISDPTNVKLCSNPSVFITLENDKGCKILSTITASVKPSDFPINSPLQGIICLDPESLVTVGTMDLTIYNSLIIKTPDTEIIEWRGPKFGDVQILDDFDANRNVGWPVTWQTPVTDTLNPNKLTTNASAKVGLYPGGDRDIVFSERIDVSEGFIFGIDVCYLSKPTQNSDRNISMVLVDDQGTKYPAAVKSISFQDANDYTWRHFEFDFSAHKALKGIAKAQLSYDLPWQSKSAYIDNLTRVLEPFTIVMPDPTAAATRDGDIFFATVQNEQGCVVEAELHVSLIECYPSATDTAIIVCEDVKGSKSASKINITLYNETVKSHVENYTVKWFSDIMLRDSLPKPTSIKANDGDIFYARVSNPGGMFDTAALTINVRSLPTLSFEAISDICVADSSLSINLATPAGGFYTSASPFFHDDSLFTISDAGTYKVKYTYSDSLACTDSIEQNITINALPEISLLTTKFNYCTVSDVKLEVQDESDAQYAWYRDGVLLPETGNSVDGALRGDYTVEKSLNGCVATYDSIIVVGYGTPPYFYHGADTICEGNVASELSIEITGLAPWSLSYSDHAGALQTVTVDDSPFIIPFAETTEGLYSFTVTEIIDSVGCPADIRQESLNFLIRPAASSPWVNVPDTSFCTNESPTNLSSYVTVPNGVFSGTAVKANYFDPSVSGTGMSKVYYAFEDANQCSAKDSLSMQVHGLPVPTFDFTQSACISDATIILATVANDSINNDAFDGTGISANVFAPAIAKVGIHSLRYSFTSIHGCASDTLVDMIVHDLPQTKIMTDDTAYFCFDATAYHVPVSPIGGTLSGIGISADDFLPSVAGEGNKEISYYFKDEFGCEQTDKAVFKVLFTAPLESKRFSFVESNIAPVISVVPLDGATVNWYASATSTSTIYMGESLTHGKATISETSYWVSQTLNGCESERTEIKLSIIDCDTPAPIIDNADRALCTYSSAQTFTAQTVSANAKVRWYDASGQLVFTGPTFTPEVIVNSHFYAVQDTGCQSMATDISIQFVVPKTPVLAKNSDQCEGQASVVLSEQSGLSKIYWFDEEPAYPANIAKSVGTTSHYTSPATTPNTYTIWAVSERDACLSEASSVNFAIKPIPAAPSITEPATACYGTAPEVARHDGGDDSELRWFWDEKCVNSIPVAAAKAYTPGIRTEALTVYAALEIDGCLGKATPVLFSVYDYIKIPEINNIEICHDISEMPQLKPSNGKPEWQTQWMVQGNTTWSEEALIPEKANTTYKMRFVGLGNCKSHETAFKYTYVNPAVPTVTVSPHVLCLNEGGTATVQVAVAGQVSGTQLFAPNVAVPNTAKDITVTAIVASHGDYTALSFKTMTDGSVCKSAISTPTSLEIRDRLTQPTVADIEGCEGSDFVVSPTAATTNDTLWISTHASRTAPIAYNQQQGGFDLTAQVSNKKNTLYLWAENVCTSENVPFDITVNPLPANPEIVADGQVRIVRAGNDAGEISVCQSSLGIPAVTAIGIGSTLTWLDSTLSTAGMGVDAALLKIESPETGRTYKYTLNTVSDKNCSIIEEYLFRVRPLPVPVIIDQNDNSLSDTICINTPYRTYSIQGYHSEDSYQWLPTAQQLVRLEYPGSTADLSVMRALPIATGIDTLLLLQTLHGCSDTARMQIMVVPQAEPDAHFEINARAGNVLLYNETDKLLLKGIELPQYFEWNIEGMRLSQSDSAYREGMPTSITITPGEHSAWLIAHNSGGKYCSDSVKINIFMPAVIGLFAPTALSPHSKGDKLSVWAPQGYGLGSYEVWVYDYWGNTVWYSNRLINSAPADAWNGRDDDGNIVDGQAFTYRIKATFVDGTKWKNSDGKEFGTILMIR